MAGLRAVRSSTPSLVEPGREVPRRTVADRLAAARQARFVGRRRELDLFAAALQAPEPPFSVLFVHGPAGIGKSALLHTYADQVRAGGAMPVLVGAPGIDPGPAALLLAAVASAPDPVVLIDGYERLGDLEGWVRRELVPGLPAAALVVIAGREPPGPEWHSDPAWADLLREVALPRLTPAEVAAFLDAAGVAGDRRHLVADAARGHPGTLALLAADATGPRLVAALAGDVPSPDHRLALDAAALARATTVRHVRAALGRDDVDDVFDWLCRHPLVRRGPDGLTLPALVRDALAADARWRDPGRHRALRTALLRAAGADLQAATGDPPRRALLDLLTLLAPGVPGYDGDALDRLRPAPVEGDLAVHLVRDHLGPDEAAWADHWRTVQPDAFRVTRDPDGVACWLDLSVAPRRAVDADPVTAAAWALARPGPGETVTVGRFVAPVGSPLGAYEALRSALTRPALTWDVVAVPDPGAAPGPAAALEAAGYDPVGTAAGRALFAHDWRRWPAGLGRALPDGAWRHARRRPSGSAVPALARPELDLVVRQCLRDLHRPAALAQNPLARTALTAGADDPAARLVEVVTEAAATLTGHPRDLRLHRVLDRTYLRPAPTQEAAAELLGLPSSTYRRHLSQAITRLADHLWPRLHP